jgi:superfamily II DNA or RNA helicase
MTQRTKPKINIVWDESVICIAPSFPQLERFLSFEEKKLEMDTTTWERKSVKIRRNVFTVLVDSPHGRVIQTYQGLKNKVVRFLQENDYEFMVHDQRMPFPEPRFDLMTGFRFSQQRLVTEMLLARQSGLLGAPTRYGKTRMILNTLRAFPRLGTVVTAPGADLIGQLYDDVRAWMPNRDVVQLGGGSNKKYPSEEITVCSMDSLHKCDTGKVELVLIDEPHAVVTDSRMPMLHAFTKARKFGFGATLSGRYDQRDMLIEGLIGPVLSNITFKEAVDEGAICPIVVVMVKMPFSPFGAKSRNGVYNSLLFKSDIMHKTIRDICTDIIPEDWQTITFIDNEAQADMMMEHMPEGTLAMAKKLTKTARQKVLDDH